MSFYRPTWAEVSPDAFVSNLQQIKKTVGPKTSVLAVLKADAYGHGATTLAPLALQNGAAALGVSSLEEGIALRDADIKAPILILGGIYPLTNFSVALDHNLTPTVASLEAAHALQVAASKQNRPVPFHLKIDTGMGRIGVSPSGAKPILDWLRHEKTLKLEGIYSHLACADSDPEFSVQQLKLLEDVVAQARAFGFTEALAHIANSAGIALGTPFSLNMVRPGLALYTSNFPVLSWQTKLIFLKKVPANTPISYGATFRTQRDSEIATLPVGYADGLPRLASNKGSVLIRNKRCPIVGRVTMDHTMIDVTGVGATVGDAVALIGCQGAETLTALDWADWAQTNSYEILCGISKRVPRVVLTKGDKRG